MQTIRITSIIGSANGIDVVDSPELDTLIPQTYPDGYSSEDLGLPYDSDGPVTLRSPSSGRYPVAPCFDHWPEEETCAPSNGDLCSVYC
jgi:hypothetical protein